MRVNCFPIWLCCIKCPFLCALGSILCPTQSNDLVFISATNQIVPMHGAMFCQHLIRLFIFNDTIYLISPLISKRFCAAVFCHGPLTRYVKLQVAHAPGMPGTFSPAADFKENRLLAIPACITASASRTCRDACRDRLHAVTGKTFPAFPAHAHPQFYVSGKRPMVMY